jgi:hypothetical protein
MSRPLEMMGGSPELLGNRLDIMAFSRFDACESCPTDGKGLSARALRIGSCESSM